LRDLVEMMAERGYISLDKQARSPLWKASFGIIARHLLFDGNTWRAVYTVRFRGFVYVLRAFQKKSKSGIATPKKAPGSQFQLPILCPFNPVTVPIG
jgi:hypothetical protein